MHDVIDTHFQDTPHAIACHRLGDVIVDPGPESSVARVVDALGGEAPRAILLTHIHLDHAGATGALVRRWPGVEVWVHERGAPHLADPAKLVASASRLYGDAMQRLWGEIVPVPEERLRVLAGGETVDGFRVEYTPGHASHHVCFLHEDSGIACVGDVAAVRIGGGPTVPPTPPPDIDIEAWLESLDVVAGWRPQALAITHFGTVSDVEPHLASVREALVRLGDLARRADRDEFERAIRRELAAAPAVDARAYEQAMPPGTLYGGLERYWTKRSEQVSSSA